MKRICKRFPGVVALNSVDLELRKGCILGLVGENGAGKSTLMRILGGIHTADSGEIAIGGSPVRIKSVLDALGCGISIIHQELNLAGNLDIASNIFLGREPASAFLGVVQRRRLYSEAAKLSQMVGINRDLATLVDELSTGEQQMVEIAKALSMSSKILVLDEPTSSLSTGETEKLFEVMKDLKASGVSMIYISHRLGEVERMCDEVVVLRDGQRVGELSGDEIDRDAMVRLMVGRDISRFFPEMTQPEAKSPALTIEGVSRPGCPHKFSFTVHSGEILGIAGLVGAGRTELMRCIFGLEKITCGRILVNGKEVRINSPGDAIHCGIGLVPEDRKGQGLVLEMAIRENITLPGICTYRPPLLDKCREQNVTLGQMKNLAIKAPNIEQAAENLSGGNQQKVVLGKWLALEPRILILDEPTRGIDVGSKSELYGLVRELADSGVAVIMVSSEMEEIMGLSDRVVVMWEGRITDELKRNEMTEEAIMQLATGGMLQ